VVTGCDGLRLHPGHQLHPAVTDPRWPDQSISLRCLNLQAKCRLSCTDEVFGRRTLGVIVSITSGREDS
jgi:hypothetical protein